MPTPRQPSRREFAKSVAAAAVAPLLGGLSACTAAAPISAPAPAVSPPDPSVSPPAAAPPPPSPAPDAAAEEDPRVEPLLAVALGRRGDRLTAEERAEVRRAIAANLRAADRLRAFELPISAEPGFPYRVSPGGGR